ncbi:extracellular solute-binding protein [Amycolatopsis australiensis]|uniref:sn-glycerol 3-phosphate transport system substrate-binding protein n=1 Tax=Amycolatopsis australiensis TaxID=546364 RepID=A0A1K1RKJ6_9PSEU|nr:extracellular solute-binding protein [Amycolatopsis australiensis]SFW72600.1 sn-glycerol 3-phosphate transport system substrate-binding protein [Amycolatopsis australiensis]
MASSNEPAEPAVIEAWLAVSPGNVLEGHGDPLVHAAESFTRAHPGYEVRIRKVEAHLMPEVVAEAVAQGNPPDVAEYYAMSTQTALDTRAADGSPLFVPVERAIAGRDKILGEPVVVDDLVPALRAHYSVGGELVSVPSFVSTNVLCANQDLLDRAGVERLPATWDELTAACAAVAALPDGPAHCVSWPNYGWLFHMEIAGRGGLIGDNGNGRLGRATRVRLDTPEVLDYVRRWKQLQDDGYYLATEELHYVTAMQAFLAGEIAFVVSSSAVGKVVSDAAAEAGIELTVGQLPRYDARHSPGGVPGGSSFFVTAGLPKEKEDGALAFLQHQLNPEHAAARMSAPSTPLTSLPITRAAYRQAMAADWAEPFSGFRRAAEQVASAEPTPAAAGPVLGNFNGIYTAIHEAIADVVLRGADPAERFRAATEQAQAALDRHNAAALADPPVTPAELRAG